MTLLINDANRVSEYYQLGLLVTEKSHLMRVYEILIKRAASKKEFPRLYKWAWILLSKAIDENDSRTLLAINQIYERMNLSFEDLRESGQFSEWHLKSIMYAWLYLPEEGPLSNKRRSEESVDRLILVVKQCQAFLNLLPKEAEKKLTSQRLNNHASSFQRPYLFRLSTNDPGIVTMTYRTPISDRLVHRRIQSDVEISIWFKNEKSLYRTLFDIFSQRGGRNLLLVNVETLTRFMSDDLIDPHLNNSEIGFVRSRLFKELGEKEISLTEGGQCFSLLTQLFYSKLVELVILPKNQAEQLGLTDSYLHSYRENSTNQSPSTCLTCHKENAKIFECGRSYCDNYCHNVGVALSY